MALIDGIMTAQGGEGPWVAAMEPIHPGLMIVGEDAVATDSVATAAMGFNSLREVGVHFKPAY